MASGRVHTSVTASMGLASILVSPILAGSYGVSTAVSLAVGIFSGILLSPDLDLVVLDTTEHKLLRWTLGLASGWIGLWYPYAMLIPHRSPFSHIPVFSTFLRLAWLYINVLLRIWVLLFVFSGFDASNTFHILTPDLITAQVFWPFFIGLSLADFFHWMLDGFPLSAGSRGIWFGIVGGEFKERIKEGYLGYEH